MIKETKILITIITIIFFLILNLFVLNIKTKTSLLIIILIIFFIFLLTTKFRNDNFYEKKSVIITTAVFGIIQVALFYFLGIFEGFTNNSVKLNSTNLFHLIIPFVLAVIVTELIRYLLSTYYKDSKKIKWTAYILMVLIDISLFHFSPNFKDLNSTLEFLGLTLFPSIISNIVFNKITMEYGYKPIIVYRVIILLSYYIFPIIPDMYLLFRTICKILIPIALALILSYMYDRCEFEEIVIKKEKLSITFIIVLIILLIFAALISCRFKYGTIVIATGSMTGTLNVGDAVIYEEYKNQELKIGDIIIFQKKGRRIVHRIVEIGIFNDKYVYKTKGDYNENVDNWLVYQDDLKGIVIGRVQYIGYPSVLVRRFFK